MMRAGAYLISGAIILCAPLFSRAEVLKTLPQANPEGKVFDVAAATVQRKGLPSGRRFHWQADGTWSEQAPKEPEYKLPQPEAEGIVYGGEVSRNEFGLERWVYPSPDGSMNAVFRKDERAVTLFPLLDITTRTGTLRNIRYPMNGMASERISLCVCDTAGTVLTTLKVTDFSDERYLTGITWSPDSRNIFVQVVDRSQHHMRLNMYDAADGTFIKTLLTEDNDAWVEPLEGLHFITDDIFIYSTDNRDGYRSLYLCDLEGGVRRLTQVAADVRFMASQQVKGGCWIYYTSAEVSPVENHLFRIRLTKTGSLKSVKCGTPERLTPEEGWHNVAMSPDGGKFIDRWSSFDNPGGVNLRSGDGALLETLIEEKDPFEGYARCKLELGTVKSADGAFDNYYRFFKPLNFDPAKKYPLIVYVYGGPHSQMVRDSWLGSIRMWEMMMAQRGYAVYVQDNRGTSNRGAAFEKAINRRCGKAETEDQMAGLEALLERCPWIDRDRIGIHGWSYGGFMTLTMFTKHPGMFKTGVAGGPVIDWKWYEVMYGERYMDTPETNPDGFRETSLMNSTDGMHGHMLICQGAVDHTVVWQHSLNFIQKCIEEGKDVDYFPYPCSEHNMRGKARVHLYEKITRYFEEHL